MSSSYHPLRQAVIFAALAAVALGGLALKLGYPPEMVLGEPLDVLHAIFVAPRAN